jgi:hypothetical protein
VPEAGDPRKTPVEGRAWGDRTMSDGKTTTLEIAPADRFLIGFGNSFTSGEGNPERPARFSGLAWPPANLPSRSPDTTTANDTRAQWTDRWCHRSVYSWQIRSALAVALADPHRSVTILPCGCSGPAIIEGLLYAWNGVEYDHAVDRGVIGSRAELGLAYQELCASFEPTNNLKLNPPTDAQESNPNFVSAPFA